MFLRLRVFSAQSSVHCTVNKCEKMWRCGLKCMTGPHQQRQKRKKNELNRKRTVRHYLRPQCQSFRAAPYSVKITGIFFLSYSNGDRTGTAVLSSVKCSRHYKFNSPCILGCPALSRPFSWVWDSTAAASTWDRSSPGWRWSCSDGGRSRPPQRP